MLVNQRKRNYETKKIKLYNTSRIKLRKVLTNISYNRVKEDDLYDMGFVFHVYILTIKKINPFSLERKISDDKIEK